MNEYFEFSLTEELIDQIVFCMEDQGSEYRIDTGTGEIRPADKAEGDGFTDLPEWKSSDGYLMMEKFISTLHNPIYKEELRNVISIGRGVFRNFKKVVKSYDPLKKKWYNFKDRYMKDLVIEWYELNREAGYFERIGTETMDTEDIILSDFSFESGCLEKYEILKEERESFYGIFPDDPILGRFYYEKMRDVREDSGKPVISVCAGTGDGTFAGIIWGWVWSSPEGSLLIIKEFFVETRYRGLGLGKVLIDNLSRKVQEEGIDRIYFEVPGNFPYINLMLEKQGYRSVCSTYSRSFGSG